MCQSYLSGVDGVGRECAFMVQPIYFGSPSILVALK